LALVLLSACGPANARDLEIHILDVEGGKSVLVVSPSGESMLIDTGWGRPVNGSVSNDRIVDALHAAHLARIDYLVISHFDIDHMGDVVQLASRLPIGHIFDHGDVRTTAASEASARQRFGPYNEIREKIGHTTLKPGDRIPIRGIDVQVVSAGGRLITRPLPHAGAPNPLCAAYARKPPLPSDIEDDQSVGLVISWGKFRMLDLADLEADLAHDLACPVNLVGKVDLYNVNVHGQFKGIAPELTGALGAPVMIQANGARKGADADTWPALRKSAGLRDIWQLHTSLNAGPAANPPDEYIANLDAPTDAYFELSIAASRDGSFTVTNPRNGFSKQYRRTDR
jgi:L-ascorbate metabolism protein UlaG (beta-lactamase superfamily)